MEVKSNLSEIYPYLQWLEPFIAEWRTKSNFETESIDISDSNDEGSDTARSITPDIEAVSDTSKPPVKPTSTKVTKTKQPSWKFHKQSSTESKKTQNVAEKAEMTLIQSLGTSTVKNYKSQEKEKDDDEIFGNLITSKTVAPRQKNSGENVNFQFDVWKNDEFNQWRFTISNVLFKLQSRTTMATLFIIWLESIEFCIYIYLGYFYHNRC